MTKKRLEKIMDEFLFWASQVIGDEDELYYVARNIWGLTDEECEFFDIKKPEGDEK